MATAAPAVFGRVVHSDDFKRLLSTPARIRSVHFAIHYVCAGPIRLSSKVSSASGFDLSTDEEMSIARSVDNQHIRHWIGTVLPKRHARRAVTRNLLRRQIKGAMGRLADTLPPGSWLIRLRQPFARAQFPSASSRALGDFARAELDAMLARAGD